MLKDRARWPGRQQPVARRLDRRAVARAEQREVTLLRGPMSLPAERPIMLACTVGQGAACNGAGVPSCNAICNNPKQGAGDCGN